MLKKAGMVAVGATAGLLALAPMASAGEAPSHHGKHHSKVDDHSKNENASSCDFTGGTGKASGGISGDAFLGNALTQIPVGGAVTSVGDCSNILQDNLNGNTLLSNIDIL